MFTLALIQLTSGDDMAANIAKVERLVKKAAAQGAEFVVLPENVFFMRNPHPNPLPKRGREKLYTQAEHPGVKASARLAKQYKIWLLAGSVAVIPDQTPQQVRGRKTHNRSLLFNPHGKIVAGYDKIHLFDVTLPNGERYAESERFVGGKTLSVADLTLTRPSP